MPSAGFLKESSLPQYLRKEQDRIETVARESGLDFFPTVFEILSYDRLNEIAAYGGFPTRYHIGDLAWNTSGFPRATSMACPRSTRWSSTRTRPSPTCSREIASRIRSW